MTADEIKKRLSLDPKAIPLLKRIVRHVVESKVLPRKIVLGPDSETKSLFDLLNRILSGHCTSEKGKYIVRLPDEMRAASYWTPLVAAIGYETKTDLAAIAITLLSETVKRLKLLFPDERVLISALAENGVIQSFVGTDKEKAKLYLKIFEAFVILKRQTCITLSQLGSDVFNDSKALRNGSLLGQLDKILRIAYDQPDLSVSELHANCGIVDNPYTSHVVAFAPFCFTTHDGVTYDYPRRLFQSGQAVVLPWETVQRIQAIQINPAVKLMTSENAAPFLSLVKAGIPSLYTEGYPNSAVHVLLRHFNQVGIHAVHFGDTDLDGYRIAEQIGRFITVDGLFLSDKVDSLPHKPLDEGQLRRLSTFIEAHPDFRFIQELRHTQEYGWVEQESSHCFSSITGQQPEVCL